MVANATFVAKNEGKWGEWGKTEGKRRKWGQYVGGWGVLYCDQTHWGPTLHSTTSPHEHCPVLPRFTHQKLQPHIKGAFMNMEIRHAFHETPDKNAVQRYSLSPQWPRYNHGIPTSSCIVPNPPISPCPIFPNPPPFFLLFRPLFSCFYPVSPFCLPKPDSETFPLCCRLKKKKHL